MFLVKYAHQVILREGTTDQRQRFRDTPLAANLNFAVFLIATASAAAGGVSWLLTFTPWTQFMSSSYFTPFFLLMFPLFGWAVFVSSDTRRRGWGRRQRIDLEDVLPRGWRIPFGVLFAAVFVSFLTAITSLPGQPQYDPVSRRYTLNDHGTLIPTTRAGYLHAIAVQNRLFLGGALIFTTLAVGITWRERNRQRGTLVTPDTWRRPVRPRPKTPLPAAVLAIAAGAGLAGSIACGVLIVDRLTAWNAGAIYLRAGHPVRATLAPGHYVVYAGCTPDNTCPKLPPSAFSATVISGGSLGVSPDPSSDNLGQAAGNFVGRLSFTVPAREDLSLGLSASPGEPVFVLSSEGEEAHALTGWIILAGLSVLVLLAALVLLIRLVLWRLGFGRPRDTGRHAPGV